MSLRYVEDQSALQQPINTGSEGVAGLERFLADGTNEVRHVLRNECDILYECRHCRAMYRSVVNFITHKRTYCRNEHKAAEKIALQIHAEKLAEMANAALAAVGSTNTNSSASPEPSTSKKSSGTSGKKEKEKSNIRRVNILGALQRRVETYDVASPDGTKVGKGKNRNRKETGKDTMELHTLPRIVKHVPVTTFEDGTQKIVGEIPVFLAAKERLPSDREIMVIPQDNSSRYREMQLRNRGKKDGQQGAKEASARQITPHDLGVLSRVEKQGVQQWADFGEMKCLHAGCEHIKAFGCIATLAMHLSVRHAPEPPAGENVQCTVCGRPVKKRANLHRHMLREHQSLRDQHTTWRAKQKAEEGERRGPKSKKQVVVVRRGRSLSPLSDEEQEMEVEKEKTKVVDEKTKVVDEKTKQVEVEESGEKQEEEDRSPSASQVSEPMEEKDDPDTPPTLTSSRGRRSIRMPKKYLDTEEDEPSKKTEYEEMEEGDEEHEGSPDSSQSDDLPLLPRQKNEEERKREEIMEKKREAASKARAVRADNVLMEDCRQVMARLVNAVVGHGNVEEPRVERRGRKKKADKLWARASSREPPLYDSEGRRLKKNGELYKKPGRKTGQKNKTPSASREASQQRDSHKEKEGESGSEEEEEEMDMGEGEEEREPRLPRRRRLPDWLDGDDYIGVFKKQKSGKNKESLVVGGNMQNEDTDVSRDSSILAEFLTPNGGNVPVARFTSGADMTGSLKNYVIPRKKTSTDKKRDVKTEVESETGSAPTTPNRRKQQFNASIDEEANSDLRMISDGSNRAAPQPEDLAMVPVFLSEGQRDQFFSPLIPVDPAVPDGSQRCSKCNDVSKSIKEGRRHMVTHIRVIRLRCRLCGVGSFFCTDLRTHLIDGFCKGLVNVPEPMPKGQGDDKAQILWADRMCCLVDPNHQGRVVYTQGMIVSAANFNAHLPDPVIEESILGKSIQDMAASNKMQHQ